MASKVSKTATCNQKINACVRTNRIALLQQHLDTDQSDGTMKELSICRLLGLGESDFDAP